MKIQGPGSTQGTSKVKKKNVSDKSSEDFGEFMSDKAEASTGASTTQSIAQVDALLALQESDDPASRASKGRARARSMAVLDELEKIRMAMLTGSLTVGHLVDVADVVASHREKIDDPALTAVLDEVDLRAQVELAKMRVALDQASAQKAV